MFDTQSRQKTKNMDVKLVCIDSIKDFNYAATLTQDKSEIFLKFKDGFEKTVFPSLKSSIKGYRRIIDILEKELKKEVI